MKSIFHPLKKSILLFSVVMWSCFGDAPRNNPLDPENSNSSISNLNGRVLTYRVPHQPIQNAKVIWNNNRYVFSDDKGNFNFDDVKKENGWLVFESEHYFNDSLYVDWNEIKPGIEQYLNAIPILNTVIFYSSIENGYPDRQDISLNFKVDVFDPDNDIDSVLINSKSMGVKTFLGYNLEEKVFEKSLTMGELNINSAEAVIGQEFLISVKDNFGNLILLTKEVVKRIIKEEVILDNLEGSDTLSVTPTLNWDPIDPGFPFEFMVEIYFDEPNPRVAYRLTNIASTITSITLETILEENQYYWVVWVIDEFENRSASKQKRFYAR
ncbi:MAG: hypothetical protein HND50_13995 [Calditrichaeota bacterium]|nr:hypothetical protein [Calditrichota bacterium]